MRAYILAIIGIVLLAAAVTLIAPSGKMGKFLKGATRLCILFVMLMPVRALLAGEAPVAVTQEMQTDEDYLAFCAKELAEGDAAAIVLTLEEEYGVTAAVRVVRNADATFSYQKIDVRILDFGISQEEEHIYMMESIREALAAHYGCETVIA